MRKSLLAVAAIVLATCSPAHADAPQIGEKLPVSFICETPAPIEAAGRASARRGVYADAEEGIIAAVQAGSCVVLPQPVDAKVTGIVSSTAAFVDEDGDVVRIHVVQIGKIFAPAFEIVRKGGKS